MATGLLKGFQGLLLVAEFSYPDCLLNFSKGNGLPKFQEVLKFAHNWSKCV